MSADCPRTFHGQKADSLRTVRGMVCGLSSRLLSVVTRVKSDYKIWRPFGDPTYKTALLRHSTTQHVKTAETLALQHFQTRFKTMEQQKAPIGKDEVPSSNLGSSSKLKALNRNGFKAFSFFTVARSICHLATIWRPSGLFYALLSSSFSRASAAFLSDSSRAWA